MPTNVQFMSVGARFEYRLNKWRLTAVVGLDRENNHRATVREGKEDQLLAYCFYLCRSFFSSSGE